MLLRPGRAGGALAAPAPSASDKRGYGRLLVVSGSRAYPGAQMLNVQGRAYAPAPGWSRRSSRAVMRAHLPPSGRKQFGTGVRRKAMVAMAPPP